MTLPNELLIEKNKLSNTYPWIVLLDLMLTGGTIYLTNNIDQVSFQSNTYNPFPMGINHVGQSIQGDMPEIYISVGNQNREMQSIIEPINGGVDSDVIMRVVHTGNLGSDYTDLERKFTITGASTDHEAVHFSLGLKSPMQRRFPLFRTMGYHCNWIFKGKECGYAGGATECNHTLTRCQQLQGWGVRRKEGVTIYIGATRFGGFPGLHTSGTKFV